ncbi:MAG: sodium:proton antiporter, partial [Alistipes sp.]|nr:sodium:proton antiporter [Alistipes sp.]
MKQSQRTPAAWVAAIPLILLTLLFYLVIRCFGGDAIYGGSQIALLSASSLAAMIAVVGYRVPWSRLEESIIEHIRSSTSAILILLLIGAISGTWMVSGVVPTLIYSGLEILHPRYFLVATALICGGVSL